MPRALGKGDFHPDFGFIILTDFHIVSQLPSQRYLDLISYNCALKTPNGFNSQTWFFNHKTRTVQSRKTPSYSLQISSSGNNPKMVITSTSSKWWMIWKMEGSYITNVKDRRVIEVKGSKDEEGAEIMANKKNGGRHQQWKLLYLKDVKEDTTKFNRGFKVDEPFYFFSRMPLNRVIGGTSYVYLQNLTKAKTQ
jgi:hypothetical protein